MFVDSLTARDQWSRVGLAVGGGDGGGAALAHSQLCISGDKTGFCRVGGLRQTDCTRPCLTFALDHERVSSLVVAALQTRRCSPSRMPYWSNFVAPLGLGLREGF